MGRQCWRLCVLVLTCPGAAMAQGTAAGEAEPNRGAALGMACVVVGALVLVVALLRTIGRRNRPAETTAAADAPERRDLVAEAMAALATQSHLGRGDEGEQEPAPGKPAE